MMMWSSGVPRRAMGGGVGLAISCRGWRLISLASLCFSSLIWPGGVGCGGFQDANDMGESVQQSNVVPNEDDCLPPLFPGVTPAMWQALKALQHWPAEERTVMRILSRVPSISERSWQRLPHVPVTQAGDEPAERKVLACPQAGEVLEMSGVAVRVHAIALSGNVAQSFQQKHYYLVDVAIPEVVAAVDDGTATDQPPNDTKSSQPCERLVGVLVASVPRNWKTGAEIREPVFFRGLVVAQLQQGLGGKVSEQDYPVLAANRMQWYPSELNQEHRVEAGHLLLARAGFDVGLLDRVRLNTQQAITSDEQDLFVEFFRAVKNIDRSPIAVVPESDWDVVDLVRYPQKFLGHCLNVVGTVQRITPVLVESPEMAARLGCERYYQLDVFLPLGNRQLKFVEPPSPGKRDDRVGSEPSPPVPEMTIQGGFGITVLLDQLPDGLSGGDDVGQRSDIEVPCFFLKQWRHSTIATQAVSKRIKKPNPIFVGLSRHVAIKDVAPAPAMDRGVSIFFSVLAVLGLVLLAMNWWSKRVGKRGLRPTETETITDLDWEKLRGQNEGVGRGKRTD